MKKIVMDLDNTICVTKNSDYKNSRPVNKVIDKMIEFKKQGFYIIINTARNMRTFDGNIGKINANTLPIILNWLEKHNVPYDEILVAKPWCGFDGFYVDDKAIRPSEFASLSKNKIDKILEKENKYINKCS